MALRVGVKRSRESHSQQSRAHHRRQQQQHDPCAMVVDDDSAHALVLTDDPGDDADREDGDEDDAVEPYFSGSDATGCEAPRRKRAMLIRANIQFLHKLPPLSNYQRGAFGRRGGVDGGTPDGDLSMHALEASMGESSVSATRPPRVAPVQTTIDSVAVVAPAARLQYPTAQSPQVHNMRRNASIAFAAHAPLGVSQQHRHTASMVATRAGKDDEARPATSGSRRW